MNKKMSDSDVQDYAFKKLTGDLDTIEAKSVFDESNEPAKDPHSDGVKISAHGVDVTINPMNGEQTKTQPKVLEAPEGDDEESELGL